MTNYNRKDIESNESIDRSNIVITDLYVEKLIKVLPKNSYIVLKWDDVITEMKHVFGFKGGDEDWLTIYHSSNDNYIPIWLSRTDTCCEPDIYDMGNYIVMVGSHA
jgi:hypothetical protein